MKIGTAQRLFPVVRMALAGVAEILTTGRHSLTKFPGEAVKRFLRDAERLQTLIGQGDADPSVGQWTVGVGSRRHNLRHATHQIATSVPIINAKGNVRGDVWRRPRTKHAALNIIEFEL